MRISAALFAAAALHATSVSAATAEEWKTRSIYQLITDRFAPPSDTAPPITDPLPATCDPALQTWCGGTWRSIIDKLDYIKSIGFDAIWISPTSKNIDVETPYHYAYHGYWITDPTQLNPRFGSEDDLMALSDELHKRDMYLMVDVAINSAAALNAHTDSLSSEALAADGLLFTDPEDYHPFCEINYGNATSVEYCWVGAENEGKFPLMDVNTESTHVQSTLQQWIADFVQKFKVDGLRIDAAKHIPGPFWEPFCKAAGVFCIGEVFGDDIDFAASFQSKSYMDSVLGFPLYYGMKKAFGQAEDGKNMSALVDFAQRTISEFPNPQYLGNFLENHDLPRFKNITADPRLIQNAMVPQFLFDGIPICYYGQEQEMAWGNHDPDNRAALWEMDGGGFQNTTTLQTMTRLNKIRSEMIKQNLGFNGVSYMDSRAEILKYTEHDVAIRKGPIIMMLTNRGSPEQNASLGIPSTGWPRNEPVIDLLSCTEFATGAGGSLSVSYSKEGYGGVPYVMMLVDDAKALGVCTPAQMGLLSAEEVRRIHAGATSRASLPAIGAVAATAALSYLL